jgi:hypothetical protein
MMECTSDTTCINNLGANFACCAGYCALHALQIGKLAYLSGNDIAYKCYANRASGPTSNPTVPAQAKNILPDFSFAGYHRGGDAIPDYYQCGPTVVAVSSPSQNRLNIQNALDGVGAYSDCVTPYAVVLDDGTFDIDAPLRIARDGVVLRGRGQQESGGTVLRSLVPSHHTVLKVGKESVPAYPIEKTASNKKKDIQGDVRVGTTKLQLASGGSFSQHEQIAVVRTPNQAWINETDMDDLNWDKDHYRIAQLRKVVSFSSNILEIDIPIVDSIHVAHGGGYVVAIDTTDTGFVSESGVEDLRITSATCAYGPCSGGQWNGIQFERTRDSWVRRVTVQYFSMAAVRLTGWSEFNTVEEVAHLDPNIPANPEHPEIPQSGHGYSFNIAGQKSTPTTLGGSGVGNLVQRCFARGARHSFVTSGPVAGPQVWLDSLALQTWGDVGPHTFWGTGLLFDNVKSEAAPGAIAFWGTSRVGHTVQRVLASEHGWTGAQVMYWNNEAPVVSDAPQAAMNWVVGGIAPKYDAIIEADPAGLWQLNLTTVNPRSLYLEQLRQRKPTGVEKVTSKQQRDDRIWTALANWKGDGQLAKHYPNPDCDPEFGTPDLNSAACCPKECAYLGGCGGSGLPSQCLGNPILYGANARSCLDFPAPCYRPDPTCQWGTKWSNNTKCCPAGCTQCGGSGCGSACSGGACTGGGCCIGGRSCAEYPAPCDIADPNCVTGVEGIDASGSPHYCCSDGCSQCGGPGCGNAGGQGDVCCHGSISTSCTTNMPACVMP